jgi:hypothetical protein
MEALGLLHGGQRLCARAVSNGRIAVLGVLREQTLCLERIRPTGVVAAVLDLIGPAHPGRGRSVTYPAPTSSTHPPTGSAGGSGGLLRRAYTAPSGYEAEREQAGVILSQPRTQAGLFTVLSRDDARPERERGVVLWFDTATGRYLGHTRAGSDGRMWTSYAPADNARLAQQLSDLIAVDGRQR